MAAAAAAAAAQSHAYFALVDKKHIIVTKAAVE